MLHNDCCWFYIAFQLNLSSDTAPSAAPLGLTVTSQTSISFTLSWTLPPPENLNGIITGYSVNVTSTATGEVTLFTTILDFMSVTSLRPYTLYLCSVAAQTTVGMGPYTSPLIVRTNEEGNCEK